MKDRPKYDSCTYYENNHDVVTFYGFIFASADFISLGFFDEGIEFAI